MKPLTLNSSACDWWMSKLCFWRPFVFCFIFHWTLWQILARTGVQMKAFTPPLCWGVGRVAASPCSCPDSFQNRTCTLLEQHSSCHCTLMDRWWLRPSAQPDGDTEGNWGGGGGVYLTFETADGCAKESEDIQLIKPKLRWVRRCRMGVGGGGGGVRWSRFLWRGIRFDGGKVPGEQRTREGKSEGDEPFPHKLKQVMEYRSQRRSFLQSKCVDYEFQTYRDTWRSRCSSVNTSGNKACPAISLVNGEMVRCPFKS